MPAKSEKSGKFALPSTLLCSCRLKFAEIDLYCDKCSVRFLRMIYSESEKHGRNRENVRVEDDFLDLADTLLHYTLQYYDIH